jgi:hypothetical protein
VKNNYQNTSLSSGLLSRVNYEIAKQKDGIRKSIFLKRLRRALRVVMQSEGYTLDASLVLKEIDKHPQIAHRTLDLLCPGSAHATLKMLFNYADLLEHTRNYAEQYCSENSINLNESRVYWKKTL